MSFFFQCLDVKKKSNETKERNSYFPCLVPKENGKETDVLPSFPFLCLEKLNTTVDNIF